MPNRLVARAPAVREALLEALAREGLTEFRASRELAWVVFPPRREGDSALEVLYAPHLGVYRVVSRDTRPGALDPATFLGEFDSAAGAAACVAGALERY